MNSKPTRRDFIRTAVTGGVAASLFPQIVSAAFETDQVKKISLEKNDVILFQGDSITDWGRAYDSERPNTSNMLGAGFVLNAAGSLLLDFPDKNLQIYNKGIAGNKVPQLSAATYLAGYRELLMRTKKALPHVKLIICEPFVLKTGKLVTDKWFPIFDEYRKVARNIATEFDAPFVPFQSVFDKAVALAPANYWSLDGIHPSVAGAALMAKAWRELVGGG
jgi:lysophospholipase L1-like esterase